MLIRQLPRVGVAPKWVRLFSNTSVVRQVSQSVPEEPEIIEPVGNRPLVPENLKAYAKKINVIPPRLGRDIVKVYEYERLRTVPTLKTFYGGNPLHEENLNRLNHLIRKFINLPTRVLDAKEVQEVKFVSFEEYRQLVQSGTRLKEVHHKELIQLLQRLRSIDPELMPKEITQVLEEFMSKSNQMSRQVKKLKTLDQFGRARAVGKRKRASAIVYLVKGQGETLVNGKSVTEFFPRSNDRLSIAYPFQVVAQEGQYNVFAKVNGGGIMAQAEAVMYGISKALIIFNPLLKSRLSKAGLMTRDTRKVERKKPGKVKARKSPTWVKR